MDLFTVAAAWSGLHPNRSKTRANRLSHFLPRSGLGTLGDLRESHTNQFLRMRHTRKPCQGVVTFGQIPEAIDTLDLFLLRQTEWYRLLHLDPPHRVRIARDESLVALLVLEA